MQNVSIDKTELDVINEAIVKAASSYQNGKTPAVGDLEKIAQDLYNSLFSYRDNKIERPLDRPVKYSLIDIFKELKFGRPAESQKYLQKCIEELESDEI